MLTAKHKGFMMALIFSGQEIGTPTGANRLGKDMDGKRVVVSGSHEAIKDHSWRSIWQTAEAMYARGEFEEIENTRVVRVHTENCKAEGNA